MKKLNMIIKNTGQPLKGCPVYYYNSSAFFAYIIDTCILKCYTKNILSS